ncbi:hypothetical protein MMC06_003427 [Schaereria dolodes]|nr:hypothetical protein [Schaereria dolodes]
MSLPYVCHRCRPHLKGQSLRFGYESRQSKRSFISFVKQPDQSVIRDVAWKEKQEKKEDLQRRGFEQVEPLNLPSDQISRRRQCDPRPADVNKLLEDLFVSTQRATPSTPVKSRYSQKVNAVAVDTKGIKNGLKTDIEPLERALYDNRAVTREVWQVFEDLRQSKRWVSSRSKSAIERSFLEETTVFRDLLFAAVRHIPNRTEGSLVPTPATVIRAYLGCGLMRNWWNGVFWSLLNEFVELQQRINPKEARTNSAQAAELLVEYSFILLGYVLDVWKIYFEKFGLRSTKDEPNCGSLDAVLDETESWSKSPNPDLVGHRGSTRDDLIKTVDLSSVGEGISTDFLARFLHFVPRKQATVDNHNTACAIAITFLCLKVSQAATSLRGTTLEGSEQFQTFVGNLLRNSRLDTASLRACFAEEQLPPQTIDQLLMWWNNFRQRDGVAIDDLERLAPIAEGEKTLQLALEHKSPSPNFSRELHTAVYQSDLKLVEKLWRRFQSRLGEMNDLESGKGFADFLRAYNSLGRPERAVDVWNLMVRSGCHPTQYHWLAMLEGCKKARDLMSLQSIWHKMNASGMIPDNQIWTTYISGLLQGRSWQACLQVIEEMGRAWKSRSSTESLTLNQAHTTSRETERNQYLPSIVPVNAALSGLIGLNKVKAALSVLKWAVAQNLKPDTSTFNILLRPAVRNDKAGEVQQILHNMEQAGCLPDVVTFTILLDGLFRNSTSSFQFQDPKQQDAAVSRIFRDMENSGIKPNTHTYGTLLDGLLARRSLNITAARAVLNHMTKRNIKPSPHIYTILVTHYFSSTPPNLTAIDSLWQRIRTEKTPVDHVFYDRMIEGYSRAGGTEKMLSFLRRMPSEGKAPGWIALLCALRALAQVEEWDLVRDLISDLVNENGLLRHGSRGWRGQEEFWGLVDELKARGVDIPTLRPAE